MFYKRILSLAFVMLFSVVACKTPTLPKQSEANVADVTAKASAALTKSDVDARGPAHLVVKNELYVDKTPISLVRQPSWLKSPIVLHGEQLPFSYYSRTLTSGSERVITHYQSGLDAGMLISMNYSGTVKGALDLLAAKTGYAYTINGNNIQWDAYITKTYDIAFMPGGVDYSVGGNANAASSGTSGGSATGNPATGVNGSAGQFSSLKGTLSVWKDLEDTVKTILSPTGKLMVSQATTTLTVSDKPANIELVGKYIENLNNNLSRQVLIKVQVLEVDLTSDFNYGINWQVIKRGFLGSNFVLDSNFGTPVSIKPLVSTLPISRSGYNVTPDLMQGQGVPLAGALQGDQNHITGVNFLIDMLEQQGKVSVVSEPRVVALNNQVSVINIVDKQGYAASVSSTTFSGGTGVPGGSSVTSTITPGMLETGLVLYVLPKILQDKIFLQVDATLSTKISIDTFTSGANGAGSASIQTPHTTEKQFNQRSVIGSGDTLILSGFRQVNNQVGAMQLFGLQALGGKGAGQTTTETVVLITPLILHGFI